MVLKHRWCALFLILWGSQIYATSLSQNLETKQDSIISYQNLIGSPADGDDLRDAYQFFYKEKIAAQKDRDSVSEIFHLYQLSRVEYKYGQYYNSEEDAVKALELIEKRKPAAYTDLLRKNIINHLGLLYHEQRNFQKSNDLYEAGLTLAQTSVDSAIIYNNIAINYRDALNFPLAYQKIQNAYQLVPKIKDSATMALILDNYGFIKFKLDQPDALEFLEKALAIRKNNNRISTYPSFNHLSQYYQKSNQRLSQTYAQEAFAVAKLLSSASYLEDALKLMIDTGHDDVSTYVNLLDSLSLARQLQTNKFALLKYDVSKKEQELKQSQLQGEIIDSQKKFYQVLAIFLGLTALLIILILHFRNKRKQLENVYNTEVRISKKVHDEVANDLYQIMSKIQGQSISKEVLLDDIDKVYDKTRNIAKDSSSLDFEQDFGESLNDLLMLYKTESIQVITKGLKDVSWNRFSDLKKTAIYRILQELLTNMKKHSNATMVVLSFEEKSKHLWLKYVDNGVGSDLRKRSGLLNVENRIKALDGNVTFESKPHKGFKATIKI